VADTFDALAIVTALRAGKVTMGRYFGTDGVRGKVGETPMTVDFAVASREHRRPCALPTGGACS
jgi:hypothetical protein